MIAICVDYRMRCCGCCRCTPIGEQGGACAALEYAVCPARATAKGSSLQACGTELQRFVEAIFGKGKLCRTHVHSREQQRGGESNSRTCMHALGMWTHQRELSLSFRSPSTQTRPTKSIRPSIRWSSSCRRQSDERHRRTDDHRLRTGRPAEAINHPRLTRGSVPNPLRSSQSLRGSRHRFRSALDH